MEVEVLASALASTDKYLAWINLDGFQQPTNEN